MNAAPKVAPIEPWLHGELAEIGAMIEIVEDGTQAMADLLAAEPGISVAPLAAALACVAKMVRIEFDAVTYYLAR